MAKPPKKAKPEEVETPPDGWERFEKAIGRMLPPKRKLADGRGTTKKR